jgi:putative ABC transport system substrate-binding protein
MTETGPSIYFRALFEELRRLGYVEGHNLIVRRYSAEGRAENLAELAREVVRQQPDVISTNTGRVTQHLRAATTTIPIVTTTTDPISLGLAVSLSRPGGNVTGYSTEPSLDLYGKYLEILREIRPKLGKIGFLAPKAMWDLPQAQSLEQAADRMSVRILGPALESPFQESEYRRVLAAMAEEGVEALIVSDSPENILRRELIIELTRMSRIPAIYPYVDDAAAGGLIAYTGSLKDMGRVCADYIARILEGASPADLPFQQPTRMGLAINLKTARELGITIPESVLARADEVIE